MHLFKHGGIGTCRNCRKTFSSSVSFISCIFWNLESMYRLKFTINLSFGILVSRLRGLNKAISRSGPASNYMFNVNTRKTRTRCEICSNLTIMIPDRRQWRGSAVFVINFEQILHLVLVFLLLDLSR